MTTDDDHAVVTQIREYRGRVAVSDHEGAELLGISLRHFRSLVARGTLPAGRRLGGCRRWLVEDLIEAFRRAPTA